MSQNLRIDGDWLKKHSGWLKEFVKQSLLLITSEGINWDVSLVQWLQTGPLSIMYAGCWHPAIESMHAVFGLWFTHLLNNVAQSGDLPKFDGQLKP
jgi:hypothetical protein